MTMTWRVSLLLILLGTVSRLGAEPAQQTEQHRFPFVPGDSLVVENDFGRVRIEGFEGSTVEITIRRFAGDAARIGNVTATCQKVGNRIFAQAYFYDYSAESVYIDVRAPRSLNVLVWGANPAVEISGVEGWVRANTLTGFISARNLIGSTSLLTEGGDISLTQDLQPAADLRLESVQGNINCHLAEQLNLRGWLRAGRKASWNGEFEILQGALERQLGIGGPVFLAVSSQGSVLVEIDPVEALRTGVQTPMATRPSTRQQDRPIAETSPGPEDQPLNDSSNPKAETRNPQPAGGEPGPAAEAAPPLDPGAVDSAGAYSLKVAVDWVYVNASVRDRYTDRAAPDLTREDFQVLEDGRHQEIEHFDSTEAPFSLLLLLDVSGSTKSFFHMLQESAIDFTRQLKPSDRVALATFNSRTRLHQDFTGDRRQVAEAVNRLRSGGGTAFYDALEESVTRFMDGVEGRKAIVVFTDGVDNRLTGDYSEGSTIDFRDLYRQIQEEDTLIYTIFLDTENDPGNLTRRPRGGSVGGILGDIIFGPSGGGMGIPGSDGAAYEEARRELELIAEQTGGRMYSPRSINDLDRAFQEIASDLRVQYTLGYHSQSSLSGDRWHDIEVRVVGHPDLAVRARRGYYGGQDRP